MKVRFLPNQQAALDAFQREIEYLKETNKQLQEELDLKDSAEAEDGMIDIYRKDLQEKAKELSVLLITKGNPEKQMEIMENEFKKLNEVVLKDSADTSDFKEQISRQKKTLKV